MKINILIIFSITILFTGCEVGNPSGGEINKIPKTEINIIGTWDYKVTTKNSICDGLVAEGIKIIVPLENNHLKIKEIIIEGTNFSVDTNGHCFLSSLYEINEGYGESSLKTSEDWRKIVQNGYTERDDVKLIVVFQFNNQNISSSVEFNSGVIIEDIATRRDD